MKKITIILTIFIISIGIGTFFSQVQAAPSYNLFGNIGAISDSVYSIGSSTIQFLRIYADYASTTAISVSSGTATTTISSATSTFAGGIQITGGGLRISTLTTASCDVKTDALGNLYCGADATGGMTINNAITGGTANRILYENSANNLAENANLFFDGTNLGIATTTPSQLLSVQGNALIAGTTTVGVLHATSSVKIGTSSPIVGFGNGLQINSLGYLIANAITSLNGLTNTSQTFANDTNVTISSAGSTHTLGWTGTLAKSRGGLGADFTTIGANEILASNGTNFISTGGATTTNLYSIASSTVGGILSVGGALNANNGFTLTGALSLPANSVTDAMVSNTLTASVLATNPTDCLANQFANAIDTGANLTCAAIADADVPDTITVSNYLLLTGGSLTGNLGIATVTPTQLLSVQGNALISGTTTAGIIQATSSVITPQFILAGNPFTNLAGTGLQVNGGVLSSTLGTSVDLTTEVTGILPRANGGTGIDFTTIQANTLLASNGSAFLLTGGATSTNLYSLASSTIGGVLSVSGTTNLSGTTTLLQTLGIGTTTPNHRLAIVGSAYSYEQKPAFAATLNIDWNDGNQQLNVLTGNVTVNMINGKIGGAYRLILCQDGTGSRTITWDSTQISWNSNPVPSTAINKCDVFSFLATNGTSTANAFKYFGAATTGF